MQQIWPTELPLSQLKAGNQVMLEFPDSEESTEVGATHIAVGTLVGAAEENLFVAGIAFRRSTGLPVVQTLCVRVLEATDDNVERLRRQRADQEEKWHQDGLKQLRLVRKRVANLTENELCHWLGRNAILSQLYDSVQQDIRNGEWHEDTDREETQRESSVLTPEGMESP